MLTGRETCCSRRWTARLWRWNVRRGRGGALEHGLGVGLRGVVVQHSDNIESETEILPDSGDVGVVKLNGGLKVWGRWGSRAVARGSRVGLSEVFAELD